MKVEIQILNCIQIRSNTMTSEANTEDDLEVDPGSNLKMAEDSGLEADSTTDQDRDQDEHEQAKIEAWLDEHPEFFQEYLIRKGKFLCVC